ncbi:hypothetical protein PP707_04105, partial [Acetobacter pasteurianus]|nr:hypothetical protein [Acetobacter pasteurianus]
MASFFFAALSMSVCVWVCLSFSLSLSPNLFVCLNRIQCLPFEILDVNNQNKTKHIKKKKKKRKKEKQFRR